MLSYPGSLARNEQVKTEKPLSIEWINAEVLRLSTAKDTSGLLSYANYLLSYIEQKRPDTTLISDLYYYIGVCNLLSNQYEDAVLNLKNSLRLKEYLQSEDENYLKGIYNIL